MKKAEIARRMARESGGTRAQAADRLDRAVHQILSNLRHGRKTSLPGLGTFAPGKTGARFERDLEEGHGSPRD
jgi:nucleoid DNA-binding protein